MAEIHVSGERRIAASPELVYSLIADYNRHHPNFLPPAFSHFRVSAGGIGAGTVIGYRLKSGMRERDYRMQIDEPEPGRVLRESDLDSSIVTTFTVSPDGDQTSVRIDTRWQGASGVGGFMERTFAPRVLRSLYDDELSRLDAYARAQSSSPELHIPE